jgi:hypothetical protein
VAKNYFAATNFFFKTYHMRILKIIPQLFLLLAASFTLRAQSPTAILDSVNAGRKPEKIFTHFDRSYYQPGDMIWFKTYITVDGRPGILSSVLKAELVNEAGTVFSSQILPITLGTASGNLNVPADLPYGTYIIRLLTQQMLNTGTTNSYKPVSILPGDMATVARVSESAIKLRFYPESGQLLNGELNVIAFTASDQLGRMSSVEGTVKDSRGTEITAFATSQNGMGKIELTPVKGERYTAHFISPNGTPQTELLPLASDEGTVLTVLDEVTKKRLVVNSRFSSDIKMKPAYILGEMDQTVVFKIDISKSNGHFMGRVPIQDLPGGLLHIAVFNESDKLLAERTCFVNSRRETVSPIFTPVTTNLSKRGENKFDFALPDSLEGTFSISVTDGSQTLPGSPSDNIITATLLSSSIQGLDYNNFYTIGPLTGETVNEAADLLLLTHEYNWNWKQLEKLAATKTNSPADNFIPFRGKALADRNSKPLPNAELLFIIQTKDSAVNSFTATTNDQGYFEVPGLLYEDTATIYVKNNSEKVKDRKVNLELMSPTLLAKYEKPAKNNMAIPTLPLFMKQTGSDLAKKPRRVQPPIDFDTSGKVLQELVVVSKANPTQQLEKRYVKGLFAGSTRNTIDLINEKPTTLTGNVFDYLRGRYAYMQVVGYYPNYSLIYRNMKSLGTGQHVLMSIYLDEMPVDASMLSSVPLRDVALIKIYTSGIMGVGGAVAVYTKRGEDVDENTIHSYMSKITWPGFSKVGAFYSPDYKNQNVSVKTDARKTIYWNPSISYIPEDGRLPVTFYNNDECREYKIVLQGFTMDGKLVYMEKIIR